MAVLRKVGPVTGWPERGLEPNRGCFRSCGGKESPFPGVCGSLSRRRREGGRRSAAATIGGRTRRSRPGHPSPNQPKSANMGAAQSRDACSYAVLNATSHAIVVALEEPGAGHGEPDWWKVEEAVAGGEIAAPPWTGKRKPLPLPKVRIEVVLPGQRRAIRLPVGEEGEARAFATLYATVRNPRGPGVLVASRRLLLYGGEGARYADEDFVGARGAPVELASAEEAKGIRKREPVGRVRGKTRQRMFAATAVEACEA
ncbi:hypothetical protein DFJ74DRAFT_684227 [Hyaloraphidium curvatum]|nr:hypothetical protein DFJ74DRAFT_684227 [Hyaloraphidium curvatum]